MPDIVASMRDTVRIGNELHAQTLDDRWPGPAAGMIFVRLHQHQRREARAVGTFVESGERRQNRSLGHSSSAYETIRCAWIPAPCKEGTEIDLGPRHSMPCIVPATTPTLIRRRWSAFDRMIGKTLHIGFGAQESLPKSLRALRLGQEHHRHGYLVRRWQRLHRIRLEAGRRRIPRVFPAIGTTAMRSCGSCGSPPTSPPCRTISVCCRSALPPVQKRSASQLMFCQSLRAPIRSRSERGLHPLG